MKNCKAESIYEKIQIEMEKGSPFNKIDPLINGLAELGEIDHADDFGLTISMRAAALGNREVLNATNELGSPLDARNMRTNANLLHYAAMQPDGGAEIIKWVILDKLDKEVSNELLSQRIFVPREERDIDMDTKWDRGNGHTVAFEGVFNVNEEVVEALIEIDKQGYQVDFKTPAVHGNSPLGWALKFDTINIVKLLKSHLGQGSTSDRELRNREDDEANRYTKTEDDKWYSDHPQDLPACNLAAKLRQYIKTGVDPDQPVELVIDEAVNKNGVDLNEPCGRFGQPMLNLVPTHPDIMDITDPDEDQKTRYKKVVELLIEKGAAPNTKERGLMEVSAGFREVFFGYKDALKLMIENVDLSERQKYVNEAGLFNGYTRLIDAALIGNIDAIELLLEFHPDYNIKGFNGLTVNKGIETLYNKAREKFERLKGIQRKMKSNSDAIVTRAGGV